MEAEARREDTNRSEFEQNEPIIPMVLMSWKKVKLINLNKRS
jgi:hypothetical protein